MNVTYCIPAASYTLSVGNDSHGYGHDRPCCRPPTHYGTEVTLTPVPNSGYVFGNWGGANAEDPSDNGDGTWSLTMDSDKSIIANFSLLPVNVPPDQPVLPKPADDATGVATPPTLEVTVSDDNAGDTLDVNFYGRAAGETAAADFTLIQIPDTQNQLNIQPDGLVLHVPVDRESIRLPRTSSLPPASGISSTLLPAPPSGQWPIPPTTTWMPPTWPTAWARAITIWAALRNLFRRLALHGQVLVSRAITGSDNYEQLLVLQRLRQ